MTQPESKDGHTAPSIAEFLVQHGVEASEAAGPSSDGKPDGILYVAGSRKYRMKAEIARGGMGIVYDAEDVNCRRAVAIKVLPSDKRIPTEDLLRFVEEAQITSQLEHPNIVPVHELAFDGAGRMFYAMKRVRGQTLTSVLLKIRKGDAGTIEQFPLSRLLNIFQKACDGVAFAHSRGVLHRDLKPDNVMISEYGEVQVMDWGLAKVMGRAEHELADTPDDELVTSIRDDEIGTGLRTMSGRVMGSPGFMAPEQITRMGDVSERADVYALGATLYSILALRPSVRGEDIKDLLRRIVRGEFPSPAALNDEESAGFRFPHCPDGRIPEALSDICMKAMALQPEARYATVQELQADLENFQNGLVWHVVAQEDFASSSDLSRWIVAGGRCEVRDGAMRLWDGDPQLVCLRQEIPGDVRIEFMCRPESAHPNDIGCIFAALPSGSAGDVLSSGYAFKYGCYSNTLNLLVRNEHRLWSESARALATGEAYRFVIERVGPRIRAEVNGQLVCSVVDPEPLTGRHRTVVGLMGWMADTRFSHVRVSSLGTPWKSDILDLAERQLRTEHYATAQDLFEEVLGGYPDKQRRARADAGLKTALARREIVEKLPAWRRRIEEAWPDCRFRLRLETEGLALDLPPGDVADLSPVRGLPLVRLACGNNRITSLEPLRGMPLLHLSCEGNPVRHLAPVQGMNLIHLNCSACGIVSLAPLAGMRLTHLDCSNNALGPGGLAPLVGMPLQWLNCTNTAASDLAPLAGLPLTSLFCEGNGIVDLGPLSACPLQELTCAGNEIASLAPLRGLPLTILHAGCNRIADLSPVASLKLAMLSCHCNRIASLAPLAGLGFHMLACGGNPLPTLEPFRDRPPKDFVFGCESLPEAEIELVMERWSRDPALAEYVKQARILLALRRKDVATLKGMAESFGGHHYLFVPEFVSWDEARLRCEAMGGHLVTPSTQEKNDLLAAWFPYGSWFWIGLHTEPGGPRWVTGEPVVFETYARPSHRTLPGPKVACLRTWHADVNAKARNCYMIEWDN
jgi:serine/threonine protein kinase/Leucine-rich repeat (LRR) protein